MSTRRTSIRSALSKPIDPEDIRPGDHVSALYVICELLNVSPFEGVPSWQEIEVRRVRLLPPQTAGPMKVVEVCLPYLLVELPDGMHRTLDVRRFRLARVSPRFGRKAFKRLKASRAAAAASRTGVG